MKRWWNTLLDRLWMMISSVNIRIKILGMVLGLVAILGITVTIQVRLILSQKMNAQLGEQSVSVAHDISERATDLILIHDMYTLHELLRDTLRHNSNVRYAFVVNDQGKVIAHTFGTGFPPQLLDANSPNPTAEHRTRILTTNEGQVWDTAVPMIDGQVGVVHVGISDINARQTVNTITGQLLLTTLLVSTIGITTATLLTWVLTRPILQLVQATQAVGRGDFTRRIPRWAEDEIGDLADAFNVMTSQLEKAAEAHAERESLRTKYVSGVISAQEDERKRIARELHDSTSQTLSSLMIGLRALAEENPPLGERVEELRQVAACTLEDVHSLALQLRPSVLDDLGLSEALHRHISDLKRRYPTLTIDLIITGLEQRLPASIETALYRIVQEALTNIIRHAEAHTASILLEHRTNHVMCVIDDDGKGFDPLLADKNNGHLGLYGMRERVELLHGQLTIESQSTTGTSLFIEIPLEVIA